MLCPLPSPLPQAVSRPQPPSPCHLHPRSRSALRWLAAVRSFGFRLVEGILSSSDLLPRKFCTSNLRYDLPVIVFVQRGCCWRNLHSSPLFPFCPLLCFWTFLSLARSLWTWHVHELWREPLGSSQSIGPVLHDPGWLPRSGPRSHWHRLHPHHRCPPTFGRWLLHHLHPLVPGRWPSRTHHFHLHGRHHTSFLASMSFQIAASPGKTLIQEVSCSSWLSRMWGFLHCPVWPSSCPQSSWWTVEPVRRHECPWLWCPWPPNPRTPSHGVPGSYRCFRRPFAPQYIVPFRTTHTFPQCSAFPTGPPGSLWETGHLAWSSTWLDPAGPPSGMLILLSAMRPSGPGARCDLLAKWRAGISSSARRFWGPSHSGQTLESAPMVVTSRYSGLRSKDLPLALDHQSPTWLAFKAKCESPVLARELNYQNSSSYPKLEVIAQFIQRRASRSATNVNLIFPKSLFEGPQPLQPATPSFAVHQWSPPSHPLEMGRTEGRQTGNPWDLNGNCMGQAAPWVMWNVEH